MKQNGYKHAWCERCDRPTFHWLDDRRVFTEKRCDDCGLRSGVDLMLLIKRFAVPITVAITLAIAYVPARHLFSL